MTDPAHSPRASNLDPFNLLRFVEAQDRAYDQAHVELERGQKRSHWIWFIFPQMRGLGQSTMSDYYGIGSLGEARAYLQDPVLGPRLRECTQLVLRVEGHTLRQILGSPDDLKFRSSMTLFAEAAADPELYRQAIAKYCPDGPDPKTLDHLRS
jgi:uncharacterized protein (DUF1810 family)